VHNDRRRQPRRIATLVAPTVVALVLAGCVGDAGAPVPAPIPPPAPAPTAPTAPDDAPTEVAAVYVVRSAPTMFFVEPIPVLVESFGGATGARVTAAVEALLGLTETGDPDLFTSVPAGTTLHRVSVDGSVVTLDLAGGIVGSSGSSSQEVTFAQQLAHTARVDASIVAVRLLIDGEPISELWGHLDWSQPIEVDPFILSPVTVTTPLAGEEVPVGPVTFRGQATVFEATVLVTLLDGARAVVEEGFVTASTGAPERGTWEWTVTLPGPGAYTLVAGESDPSDGEGRPPFSTTRIIRAAG
jgi:hypothetical protein